MASTDSPKRKEPEQAPSATQEPPAKVAKVADAPAAKTGGASSGAVVSIDPKVVRKQVEYYMSDDNLKHDKFFHEKISSDGEGWLDMALVLTCNKMKALRATREDVVTALKDS